MTDLVADGRAVPADFGAPGEPAPADRWVISMDSRGTLHGTGPAG